MSNRQCFKNNVFTYRSNSESSQDQTKLGNDLPGSEVASSHYTFGLNPAVVVETTDSDNEDKNSYREAVNNEIQSLSNSKDTELSILPGEPKSRSSYGSSIGYIDEEAEKRDKMAASTLDRKIYASKASSMFGHIKTDSPPDLDKQNSWPRTLSSFMCTKEPAKFTVSDMNTTNQRHLGECPDRHSFQIIPLQVRPSTPSGLSTFNPAIRDGEFSKISPGIHSPFSDTASLPDRSIPHHHLQHHHHHPHHGTPDRYTRTLPGSNRSWKSPSSDDVVAEECQVTISGPNMRFCVPQGPLKTQSSVQTETAPPDPETFRIWEEQGLVSPNEAMFSESAASRL